jgi:hypothetical protein
MIEPLVFYTTSIQVAWKIISCMKVSNRKGFVSKMKEDLAQIVVVKNVYIKDVVTHNIFGLVKDGHKYFIKH